MVAVSSREGTTAEALLAALDACGCASTIDQANAEVEATWRVVVDAALFEITPDEHLHRAEVHDRDSARGLSILWLASNDATPRPSRPRAPPGATERGARR